MKIFKKVIKKVFHIFGLDIIGYKKKISPFDINGNDLVQETFNYFNNWVSKFEINNKFYGGLHDYTTERISVLNVPELYKYVDFKNKRILELGPLEGGNTIILEKLNPSRIVSIEARVDSYIKCCLIKNIYNLKLTKFYLGDIRDVSFNDYGTFDIAFIAGVLYHLDNPYLLLKQLSTVVNNVVIATHHADVDSPSSKIQTTILKTDSGDYKGKLFSEGNLNDPNCGIQEYSFWPYKDELLRMCRDVGFKNINIIKENPVKEEKYKLIYFVAKKD